jgi:hypothetical protein
MASLLPHQVLEYKNNGTILVDGKPTASLDQRNAMLSTVDGVAIRFDELVAMKKEQGREFISGKRVVYVYHNRVDAIGDSASTEANTFQAVRDAMTEVADTVRYLINLCSRCAKRPRRNFKLQRINEIGTSPPE